MRDTLWGIGGSEKAIARMIGMLNSYAFSGAAVFENGDIPWLEMRFVIAPSGEYLENKLLLHMASEAVMELLISTYKQAQEEGIEIDPALN